MKLNPDCIREILIAIEERSEYNKYVGFDEVIENVNFPENEVLYHIQQCEMNGFIIGVMRYLGGGGMIKDLSPKAHEFLANIRSESNWNKIKKKASEVGTFSLNALAQIAINYVSSKIG